MKNILFLGTTLEERLQYPSLTQVTCLRLQAHFPQETSFVVYLVDRRNKTSNSETEYVFFDVSIKYISICGNFDELIALLPNVQMDMIANDFATVKFMNPKSFFEYVKTQKNLSVISIRDLYPNYTKKETYDISLTGNIKVYVKDLNGKTHTIHVSNKTTIENIKKKLYGNPNILLIFAGMQLENDMTIGDYNNINNESTLHLAKILAIEDTKYIDPLYKLGFECRQIRNGNYIITRSTKFKKSLKRKHNDDSTLR